MTGATTGATTGTGTVRADVWLWRARFFRTRSLATRFLIEARVRMTRGAETRILTRPATLVGPGDRLTLPMHAAIRHIEIVQTGTRRGPPAEARTLYADVALGVGENACSTSSNNG